MENDKYKSLKIFYFADLIGKSLPDKKTRGLIFGNFGAMNLGDEAILTGQLNELSKIPNLTLNVVSRSPENTEKDHKVRAIALYNIALIMKELANSDFAIVGGGGIICKTDRGLIGFCYQLYMILLYLLLPLLFRKKVYSIGLGIYRNSNPLILGISTYLLRFSKIVTVRDYHSLDYLKSKNINVSLYKDNSFLMNLIPKSDVLKNEFFKKHYNSHKKNVGLALMQPENKDDEKRLISEIIDMVSNNYKSTNFWFYSCDYQNNFFNDYLFSKKIYDSLISNSIPKESLIVVPTDMRPDDFFSSFQLMDFIITMRLHGAIFAYRNDIDFLGITYDEKCSSFLESIGKTPVPVNKISLT